MNATQTSPAPTTAPSTLAEVFKPLITVLTAYGTDENPVSLEEDTGIPGLPDADPAIAVNYYVTADNKDSFLRRLERFIRIAGIPDPKSPEFPTNGIPGPMIVPIKFHLIRLTAGLFGGLTSEYYLLAELETEKGDLASAERQVGLLVERLNKKN